MPTHCDLWIRRNEIRPLWRDRANGYIIDSEQKSLSIAVVSLTHARELPAAERMERMRYPHKTRGCDRITCISNGATSAYQRVGLSGGRQVASLRKSCGRIRHSCSLRQGTRTRTRRRYGGK